MTSTKRSFPKNPEDFASWRDFHKGEAIVVSGLAPSAADFAPFAHLFTTIGVNDVARFFIPTYMLIVDNISQFKTDRNGRTEREHHVRLTGEGAEAVFTQLRKPSLGFQPKLRVQIPALRRMNQNPCVTNPAELPCTNNSPYVAVALAAYLGASAIGVVGVDLKGHSFETQAEAISRDFHGLVEAVKAEGGHVINLSTQSLVKSIPVGSMEDLLSPAVIEELKRKEFELL